MVNRNRVNPSSSSSRCSTSRSRRRRKRGRSSSGGSSPTLTLTLSCRRPAACCTHRPLVPSHTPQRHAEHQLLCIWLIVSNWRIPTTYMFLYGLFLSRRLFAIDTSHWCRCVQTSTAHSAPAIRCVYSFKLAHTNYTHRPFLYGFPLSSRLPAVHTQIAGAVAYTHLYGTPSTSYTFCLLFQTRACDKLHTHRPFGCGFSFQVGYLLYTQAAAAVAYTPQWHAEHQL